MANLENITIIEMKIEKEKLNVALLKEHTEKYNCLTKDMTRILDSFESRLEKLENTILPLFNVTKTLQLQQHNLDLTLQKLDTVLDHYKISQEVCEIVHRGPEDNIENFLEALDKLKIAKEYFLTNNPNSVELENVTSLFNTGCDTMNNYFKQLLKKHSAPMRALDLLDLIYLEDDSSNGSEDYPSSIKQLPPKTRDDLNIIARWLDENLRKEYMTLYSDERSEVISKSLQKLKDHQKSGSWGSENPKPKYYGRASVSAESSKKTATLRLQSIFERKANKLMMRAKTASQTLGQSTGLSLKKPHMASNENFLNEETFNDINNDQELEKYLVLLLGLQKLLVWERNLMNDIIPISRQNEVFSNLAHVSIEMIVKDAESITSRVLRSISRKEWSSALGVFSALKHVQLLQPDIDKICNNQQKQQLGGVLNKLQQTAAKALEQFIDNVKSESSNLVGTANSLIHSSVVPKDATIYELTSNTIWFLEHLSEYYEIIGNILKEDHIYNGPLELLLTHKNLNQDQRNRALLGIYIRKVLTELNLTIVTKAESYSDYSTKNLFKLNNIYYILKSLQRNNLIDIVAIGEIDCEKRYHKMIEDLKKSYQLSWQKLANNVSLEDLPKPVAGKLKDKERAIIKERFATFNKELEETCRNQKSISVPDIILRESLKRDNSEQLIPHYNAFYEMYADVQFSKNPEKYIKYRPTEVTAMLNNLFDDTI